MVTKQQAMTAREFHYGTCKLIVGPRGGTTDKREVWRANGACKLWKTRPDDFSLPIKYGFNGPYSYINNLNAEEFHVAAECAPTMVTK